MIQALNAEVQERWLEFEFGKKCRKAHCSNLSIAVNNISNRTLWVSRFGK